MKGTCQICGKQFKLKNGKLPTHGHRFGYRMPCHGSQHLPAEVSTEYRDRREADRKARMRVPA